MHGTLTRKRKNGFSLVELVIVVVILGIIGAIAIPRMSRGAAGASDSGLVADLAVLRNAIELYAAEHNGAYPTVAKFTEQLTTYTNAAGGDNASKTAAFKFGPYLTAVPNLKVGDEAGGNSVAAAAAVGVAWVYDEDTGVIRANAASPYDAY
ncbi:MAG: prepilin-type N-terminal cleavage/methylation domain-containing protein [Planctomycetota bacterium]